MQIELESNYLGVTSKNVRSLTKLIKGQKASLCLNDQNLFNELILELIQLKSLKVMYLSMKSMTINKYKLKYLNSILKLISDDTIRHEFEMKHLFLDLYNNGLRENGLRELGQALSYFDLHSLYLNINRCLITHKGLKIFGDFLTKSQKNLKALKILLNEKVYNQGVWCLFSSLSSFQKLEELDLRFNSANIDGQSIYQLSLSISKLKSLRILQLNFYNNQIDNNAFRQLCKSIKQIENLYELFLDFSNNPQLNNMACLSRSIYNKKLASLSYNFIGNQIKEMNLRYLSQQSHLLNLSLKLSNNDLSPIFCFDFSQTIINLSSLKDLRIWIFYNDRIQQLFFEMLCNRLPLLSNLKHLQLYMDDDIKGKERLNQVIINNLDYLESIDIQFKNDSYWINTLNKQLLLFLEELNQNKLQLILKNKFNLIL